jgi:hypothetical protein
MEFTSSVDSIGNVWSTEQEAEEREGKEVRRAGNRIRWAKECAERRTYQ